jgi:hypothetical protein
MNRKIARPRLDYWELATLWRLLDEEYRHIRAEIKWNEERIASGQINTHAYPVEDQKEHLRCLGRLRRRLGKLVKSLKEG